MTMDGYKYMDPQDSRILISRDAQFQEDGFSVNEKLKSSDDSETRH